MTRVMKWAAVCAYVDVGEGRGLQQGLLIT
jgi:hypothetical protein